MAYERGGVYWCSVCGTWRGAHTDDCKQTACSACGVVQCHSHGLSRGCCHVCHFGRLPGWSFSRHPAICTVKGCTAPAVYAYLPGSKKDCCKVHGDAILARRQARTAERTAQRRY